MLLYIIRHGDPIYVTDTLTERGKLQAEAVGKRLAKVGIDRIFTSPMGRARETAEPLCRLLGKEYTVEDWTHEIEDERLTPFPDGVMKSVSVVQNTYFRADGNLYLDYEHAGECDGFRESGMAGKTKWIEAQGDAFLERLGYRKEGENYRILFPNEEKVALFCHGAFGRAWISTLLHIPLHMMWASFEYTHTGVTVLKFENYANGITAPRCLCYSDISHLYAAGLDTRYNGKIEI
jgi:probable phosphoglycerate mutase